MAVALWLEVVQYHCANSPSCPPWNHGGPQFAPESPLSQEHSTPQDHVVDRELHFHVCRSVAGHAPPTDPAYMCRKGGRQGEEQNPSLPHCRDPVVSAPTPLQQQLESSRPLGQDSQSRFGSQVPSSSDFQSGLRVLDLGYPSGPTCAPLLCCQGDALFSHLPLLAAPLQKAFFQNHSNTRTETGMFCDP